MRNMRAIIYQVSSELPVGHTDILTSVKSSFELQWMQLFKKKLSGQDTKKCTFFLFHFLMIHLILRLKITLEERIINIFFFLFCTAFYQIYFYLKGNLIEQGKLLLYPSAPPLFVSLPFFSSCFVITHDALFCQSFCTQRKKKKVLGSWFCECVA